MTVIKGTRFAAVAPKQTYTFTRPAAAETSGLSTVLPTTEPGTSQITYTVQASDLYVSKPLVATYIFTILACVANLDASTRTLSYRTLKNGSSVATGTTTTMAASTGGCEVTAGFTDVAAGDVLELRLWSASSSNVQLQYYATWLQDTRHRLSSTVFTPVVDLTAVTSATKYPVLSSYPGTGQGGVPSLVVNPADVSNGASNLTHPINTTKNYPAFTLGPTYGYGRVSFADSGGTNTVTTSMLAPASATYVAGIVLSSLAFRRVAGVV